MWCATLMFGLLLGHAVRSEVSQSSPPEQTVKPPEDTNVTLPQMVDDYKNLFVDVLGVPSLNQTREKFKDMCDKNGGNDSYTELVTAIESMHTCFTDLISYAEVPAKIKKSKPYGELDTVFKEYCHKSRDVEGCVHKMLIKLDPCFEEHQRKTKYTLLNVTQAILGFVCENEGDHIALFISEKGPECILGKQPGIKKCVQSKYRNATNPNPFAELTPEEVYNFNFTNEHDPGFQLALDLNNCRIWYQMRKCIVEELTGCSGSTPANVVDSIFNLVHKSTNCAKYDMREMDPDYNRGTSLFISFFSVVIPALTVLLVRTFNS